MTAKNSDQLFRTLRSRLAFGETLSWHVVDAAEHFVCEAADETTAKLIARALNKHFTDLSRVTDRTNE